LNTKKTNALYKVHKRDKYGQETGKRRRNLKWIITRK